jgi:hypothetical protein
MMATACLMQLSIARLITPGTYDTAAMPASSHFHFNPATRAVSVEDYSQTRIEIVRETMVKTL